MRDYIIYTDGGYSISNNVGSSAYVILRSDGQTLVKQDAFVLLRESSQRAEFKAIIAAVYELPDKSRAKIYTDNQYAAAILGKVPKRKNKPDKDLLVHYKQLVRAKKLTIEFTWVRSHIGHTWNELCDSLCTEALAMAEGNIRKCNYSI
jgi:ribonuclease HI